MAARLLQLSSIGANLLAWVAIGGLSGIVVGVCGEHQHNSLTDRGTQKPAGTALCRRTLVAVLLDQAEAATAMDHSPLLYCACEGGSPSPHLAVVEAALHYERYDCAGWGSGAGVQLSNTQRYAGMPSECGHLGDCL